MSSWVISKHSKRPVKQALSSSSGHRSQINSWLIAMARRARLPVYVRRMRPTSLVRCRFMAVLTGVLGLLLVAGVAQPVAAQLTLLDTSSRPHRSSLLWQTVISLPDSPLSEGLQAAMDISKRTGLFGLPADAFSSFSVHQSQRVDHLPHSGKRSRALEASLTVPLMRHRMGQTMQTLQPSQTSRLSFDLQGGLGVLTDDPRGFDSRGGMSFGTMLGVRLSYLTYLANHHFTFGAGYRFRQTSNASLANAGVRPLGPHAFFAELSYFWS